METNTQIEVSKPTESNKGNGSLEIRTRLLIGMLSVLAIAICVLSFLDLFMSCFGVNKILIRLVMPLITIGLWNALLEIYGFNFKKMGWPGVLGILCLLIIAFCQFILAFLIIAWNMR